MTSQTVLIPLSVKMIYESESTDAPYVAYAPELDISSCGASEREARKHLADAVNILFEEASRKGKLDELLEDAGYRKKQQSWIAPMISFQQVSVHLKQMSHAQNFSYSLS